MKSLLWNDFSAWRTMEPIVRSSTRVSFTVIHANSNCYSHSNTCLDGSITSDLSADIALWD